MYNTYMGYETRGNQRYFYLKERQGGKVVSRYLGNGIIGELAHAAACEVKFQHDLQQADLYYYKTEIRKIEQISDDFDTITRTLTKAVLISNGYHTHRRQWRKKRRVKCE